MSSELSAPSPPYNISKTSKMGGGKGQGQEEEESVKNPGQEYENNI